MLEHLLLEPWGGILLAASSCSCRFPLVFIPRRGDGGGRGGASAEPPSVEFCLLGCGAEMGQGRIW